MSVPSGKFEVTKGNLMNFDPIFGESNEIVSYLDDMGNEWSVSEVEEYYTITGNRPTKKEESSMSYDEMATELSALMDAVEAAGFHGSSDDGDPRMTRISELASLLSWFAPEKLDKRFGF
jgi:hypothetical protein